MNPMNKITHMIRVAFRNETEPFFAYPTEMPAEIKTGIGSKDRKISRIFAALYPIASNEPESPPKKKKFTTIKMRMAIE